MKILAHLAWPAMASIAAGQTAVDLRTQSKSVDFSAAAYTKPSKTGTVLPALCAIGETFFKTDATPGSNLYLCGGANSWSQIAQPLEAGQGVQILGNQISTEAAIIPIYYTGVGAPTLACVTGRDFYVDTVAGSLYFCKAADVWQSTGGGGLSGTPLIGYRFGTIASSGNSSTPTSIGDTYVSSGTASNTVPDAVWGHRINLASAATAGATGLAGGQAIWRTGRNVIFAAFGGVSSTQAMRAHIGLTDAGALANMFGTDAPAQKYISFRYISSLDGSTWKCVGRNSGAPQVEDTGVAAAGNAPHWFEIVEEGATATCKIDGVPVATLSTNVPSSGTNLRAVLGVETTEAVAKTISFGAIQMRSNF